LQSDLASTNRKLQAKSDKVTELQEFQIEKVSRELQQDLLICGDQTMSRASQRGAVFAPTEALHSLVFS
jgi:hypothetical protein